MCATPDDAPLAAQDEIDVRALRVHGLSDQEIADLANAVAVFARANCLMLTFGEPTSTRHGDSQESRVGGFGLTLGSRARRNGRGVARAALSLAIVAASAVTSLLKVPSTSTERLLSRPFWTQ